ncbi:hypothetical protein ABH907_001374 [Pseudomonas frederiksbergensis]|uniref:DUF2946 domain-containing protein n=1 Tax=Pseudomonas frederiksbergensis TaxID=104087 RepID=UPI003D219A52
MRPHSASPSVRRRQSMSLTRGSWISLFAMLMIFIGPLISQSMPMDSRAAASSMAIGMSMNMSMDMGSDMSAMEHADHDAQPAAEHCQPTAEHHALWEKMRLLQPAVQLPGAHRWRFIHRVRHPARHHLHHTRHPPGPRPANLLPRRPHPRPAHRRVNTHL